MSDINIDSSTAGDGERLVPRKFAYKVPKKKVPMVFLPKMPKAQESGDQLPPKQPPKSPPKSPRRSPRAKRFPPKIPLSKPALKALMREPPEEKIGHDITSLERKLSEVSEASDIPLSGRNSPLRGIAKDKHDDAVLNFSAGMPKRAKDSSRIASSEPRESDEMATIDTTASTQHRRRMRTNNVDDTAKPIAADTTMLMTTTATSLPGLKLSAIQKGVFPAEPNGGASDHETDSGKHSRKLELPASGAPADAATLSSRSTRTPRGSAGGSRSNSVRHKKKSHTARSSVQTMSRCIATGQPIYSYSHLNDKNNLPFHETQQIQLPPHPFFPYDQFPGRQYVIPPQQPFAGGYFATSSLHPGQIVSLIEHRRPDKNVCSLLCPRMYDQQPSITTKKKGQVVGYHLVQPPLIEEPPPPPMWWPLAYFFQSFE